MHFFLFHTINKTYKHIHIQMHIHTHMGIFFKNEIFRLFRTLWTYWHRNVKKIYTKTKLLLWRKQKVTMWKLISIDRTLLISCNVCMYIYIHVTHLYCEAEEILCNVQIIISQEMMRIFKSIYTPSCESVALQRVNTRKDLFHFALLLSNLRSTMLFECSSLRARSLLHPCKRLKSN